ncbi:MAG: 30S ribosomal protein S18 [Candidatus Woesebacteria bacterium GW2011_GWA1_39_21]|uniref:Small ribosomal subunit protein bS18 n=1 Tax=Candidatus Woesebacteria bacterium GW2011_GWA1_39_21 TaxID=1618550 RepID=A0A0G0NGK5_9BACT|nr:MAG: 30S ribosomal protein S18 [Candidatus Woesebacteria bacterium GW2011_GWA1_39_21]
MAKVRSSRKPQIPKKSKKDCPFCKDKSAPDYKKYNILQEFISDRGKMIPSVYTGVCTRHQKKLSESIKRARFLGLLPFTPV